MSRLQELLEIGWANLNKSEREEYQKLKAAKEEVEQAINGPAIPKNIEVPKETSQGDLITLSKTELQDMINEGIENYRKHIPRPETQYDKWEEVKPGEEQHQTAQLKLYQKDARSPFGVVIRADYLKTDWNEETHKHDRVIYEIEILYDDGKTDVIEMDTNRYTQLNQTETVELIKNDRKKLRRVEGKVGVPIKDAQGYPIMKMNMGGYGSAKGIVGEVEREDIKYDEVFTVRRPNGQEFKIHSKYLNN